MKKTTILLVGAFFCLNFCAKAQNQNRVLPLKVGDKLPETFWQQEHTFYQNGKSIKQTLANYKGKLLILDFWATWCSSCFSKFPRLDSLQQKYPNELAIVLVNKITSDKDTNVVKQAFDKHAKGFAFNTVMADEYLGKSFPHWGVPHYVWINKLGIVMAMTGSDFVNDTNIKLSIARFSK